MTDNEIELKLQEFRNERLNSLLIELIHTIDDCIMDIERELK